MGLTVVSVAYPFAPVTADPAGGAEQVLAQIDRALVRAGHRSRVVAPEGSCTAGELIAVPAADGEIDETRRAAVHEHVRAALAAATREGDADVVHLHGIDFGRYLPAPGTPTLATLHLPLDWYAPEALAPGRPATWLNPVSDDQARRAPAGLRLLAPIPNGVDTEAYRPGATRQPYALALGRVAPEKGFHHALDAARMAGVPLLAAGRVFAYAAHLRYFDEEVAPRLDAHRRWIGPVEGAAKRRLIAEARCVLIASTAPETSSLVAMEALASGTPVIAFRAGALPDIVEHGLTGLVVDTVEEMAEAIGRIGAIDPAACRRAACARFPVRRTTEAYLRLYAELAA
ncbi:D-inositol-3-phosphate glycosyltransferase [Methylobacterium crusticola]|uniref:D-inositol-3-phosphate glycosyltransferase n=1 Tax=Methylobacterium crusticola TaxID=1697972 RepID=A0ABQ4R1A7_9HYPH|nr:glycosyltransferase [Methylobacterium crusticola]GJD51224.1 D-inositol-3-phosphate glycosyltransferase [Methylobacterium crusticola]